MNKKVDIRNLDHKELTDYFKSIGEARFRADQVHKWLWQDAVLDFNAMTNLSKSLREKLDEHFYIQELAIADVQASSDGTRKYAFRMHDGNLVEGVLIPTEKRLTACISTQVGCSLACTFCATGQLKRMRNLGHSEIYDQVVAIDREAREHYGRGLTNIVYMGMGEPLLNYKNTLSSIHYITDEKGLGMSPRRITVSTAGIAKAIERFADDDPKVGLALSLHAANDAKRDTIMGINETNNLDRLAKALRCYHGKTGKMVTFEYIIFRDFNDSLDDARELLAYCQRVPSKVNIIEYNDVEGTPFKKSPEDRVNAFAAYLEGHGVTAKIRRSRGKDIDAACGQLANKV